MYTQSRMKPSFQIVLAEYVPVTIWNLTSTLDRLYGRVLPGIMPGE